MLDTGSDNNGQWWSWRDRTVSLLFLISRKKNTKENMSAILGENGISGFSRPDKIGSDQLVKASCLIKADILD